tara:strand:+ start:99 stop:308 length:210 start_codon:yes stop_codon:yes gene_type:complete
MAEANSSAENMQKGKGIIGGFKTVGTGSDSDNKHPAVTGEDPGRKGPGRPPKNESSFTQVGKPADPAGQ